MSRFETVFSTQWFSIEASASPDRGDPFYRIRQPDSVVVLPMTADGEFVLVRQFRPALEKWCVEFPAGGIDPGETPEDAARRELLEETGHVAEQWDLVLEGVIRLERETNRNYFFFARHAKEEPNQSPEPGLTVEKIKASTLRDSVNDGSFDHIIGLSGLMATHMKFNLEEFGF